MPLWQGHIKIYAWAQFMSSSCSNSCRRWFRCHLCYYDLIFHSLTKLIEIDFCFASECVACMELLYSVYIIHWSIADALSSWKRNHLSLGGRIDLIKASLLIFLCIACLFSCYRWQWGRNWIRSGELSYGRGRMIRENYIPWSADNVIEPKGAGGLRLGNLEFKNQCCLLRC